MINTLTELFPILNGTINNNNKWVVLEKDTTIIRYLKTDYSEAFSAYIKNANHMLFRGTDYVHNAIVETPRKRISITGNNMLTELFSDILPSWNNMPKRNQCIMGINSFRIARMYNNRNTYCMFPKNGAIVAIANKPCIQNITIKLNKVRISIGDFMILFKSILRIIHKLHESLFIDINAKDLINLFSLTDIMLKDNDNDIMRKKIMRDMNYRFSNYNTEIIDILNALFYNAENNISIIDFLNDILSPNNLDIKSTLYKDFEFNEFNEDNEIWTESPCLLIEHEYFFDVISKEMHVYDD